MIFLSSMLKDIHLNSNSLTVTEAARREGYVSYHITQAGKDVSYNAEFLSDSKGNVFSVTEVRNGELAMAVHFSKDNKRSSMDVTVNRKIDGELHSESFKYSGLPEKELSPSMMIDSGLLLKEKFEQKFVGKLQENPDIGVLEITRHQRKSLALANAEKMLGEIGVEVRSELNQLFDQQSWQRGVEKRGQSQLSSATTDVARR